ncbi:DUF3325 domain-containing protein [Pseudomonas sp. LRF_L74]|uniref:DUF3325 domain-containing protein n=1 Tax=Pseudomonas sp. LRF_L74 TaxID=3369422 RepID=UPI003F6430CE
MIIAALVTSLGGFIALALAMDKHCKHLLRRVLAPRWMNVLTAAGWGLLALSLGLCCVCWGVSIGIAAWSGWLTLAGILLVFYMPNWPWQPEQPKAPPRREKKGVVVDAQPVVEGGHWLRKSATGGLLLVPLAVAIWFFIVMAGR